MYIRCRTMNLSIPFKAIFTTPWYFFQLYVSNLKCPCLSTPNVYTCFGYTLVKIIGKRSQVQGSPFRVVSLSRYPYPGRRANARTAIRTRMLMNFGYGHDMRLRYFPKTRRGKAKIPPTGGEHRYRLFSRNLEPRTLNP